MQVAAPEDETTPSGKFQLRCGDLISEIQKLGFGPGGWIGLINQLGAVDAAKRLLEDHRILPVTHWLVDQKHPELTMEHEIGQPQWADLFDQSEREEAARRLASAGRFPSS